MNIHRITERFLSLIRPLQLKNDLQQDKLDWATDKLDWATDVLEHWKSISLNDPEVPATSKIRVLAGTPLQPLVYCITPTLKS